MHPGAGRNHRGRTVAQNLAIREKRLEVFRCEENCQCCCHAGISCNARAHSPFRSLRLSARRKKCHHDPRREKQKHPQALANQGQQDESRKQRTEDAAQHVHRISAARAVWISSRPAIHQHRCQVSNPSCKRSHAQQHAQRSVQREARIRSKQRQHPQKRQQHPCEIRVNFAAPIETPVDERSRKRGRQIRNQDERKRVHDRTGVRREQPDPDHLHAHRHQARQEEQGQHALRLSGNGPALLGDLCRDRHRRLRRNLRASSQRQGERRHGDDHIANGATRMVPRNPYNSIKKRGAMAPATAPITFAR